MQFDKSCESTLKFSRTRSLISEESPYYRHTLNRNSELERSMGRAMQQLQELDEFGARLVRNTERRSATVHYETYSSVEEVEISYFTPQNEPVSVLYEIRFVQGQLELARSSFMTNERALKEVEEDTKRIRGRIGDIEETIHDVYLLATQPRHCTCSII